MKKQSFQFILISVLLLIATGALSQKIKVACIGNSITAGAGIVHPELNSYPAQLQALLGDKYQVTNYGVSGATLLKKGNRPYWLTDKYKQALASNPDIVFIKLGTNDSKAINRVFLNEFKDDYDELIRSFAQLSSHPRIILLLPLPSLKTDSNSIFDPVIKGKVIPFIQQLAYKDSLEVIDLHSMFIDKPELLPDGIHPHQEGAALIAVRLHQLIIQKRDLNFNISSNLPVSQKVSSFYGYICNDFTLNGRNCKVVKPKWAVAGHPWVWRARFWGHEPQADIALLEHGFHIVYCDVAELYGNKEAVELWNNFYDLMHKAGLAKKVALEGMSRGGVYLYNWAAENPKKVACVYADNPVLDLKSWPGGKGKGPGSQGDWIKVQTDYNLKTPEEEAVFDNSPINKVKQIVKGHYPMLHLLADADEVVPPEENTIPFEQKVKELGGNITVYHKPGFKHHPHSLPNPAAIVDFILKYSGIN